MAGSVTPLPDAQVTGRRSGRHLAKGTLFMKFSVLLPTRNGGKFLHNCIASVLEQPYADMELVISDNANTDETSSVVESFAADPRVKYVRLDELVPVTENWRTALDASQGDYTLMIGDDDCLLPGYFERMAQLIEQYDQPECLVYNGYGYVFPYSIDGNQSSYYVDPRFDFGPEYRPGELSREMRLEIVRDMFRFKVRYPLMSQLTLVSRRAADRIEGGMFQPPFPDHYAVNALLLEAETFVHCPEKLLVTGTSPKSFGYYSFSDQHGKGMNYLGADSSFEGRLPGNEQLDAMYVWLARLKTRYPIQLGDVAVSRADYVRHQVFGWYVQFRFGSLPYRELLARCRKLAPRDWVSLALSPFDEKTRSRLLNRVKDSGLTDGVKNRYPGLKALDDVKDIKEFAAWVSPTKGGR